jgi:hypothetical protein
MINASARRGLKGGLDPKFYLSDGLNWRIRCGCGQALQHGTVLRHGAIYSGLPSRPGCQTSFRAP